MRTGPLLALALLSLLVPAGACEQRITDEEGLVPLYVHWQGSVPGAIGTELPMDELYPHGEPDLSEGPVTPGTTLTGDLPRFTFALSDWFGRQGPMGTLLLDPARDAELSIFLSADQTAWPSPAGPPPQDVDYGVVPRVTVEVLLRGAEGPVGHGALTQDLFSLPDPAGVVVHEVTVPVALERFDVQAGSGLWTEVTLYQLDAAGNRVVQNLFNVHTGEAYPTTLRLPALNPLAIYLEDHLLEDDEPLDQGIDGPAPAPVPTRGAPGPALVLSVVSLAGAALAFRRR